MAKHNPGFSAHQILTLIYMVEGFQAAARSHVNFPWGALASRQSWFMYEAFPILERTAMEADIDTSKDTWMHAVAGVFGSEIANYAQREGALPRYEVVCTLALNAVG